MIKKLDERKAENLHFHHSLFFQLNRWNLGWVLSINNSPYISSHCVVRKVKYALPNADLFVFNFYGIIQEAHDRRAFISFIAILSL